LQLSLEIKTGRFAGRIISVPEGQSVTVGRTPRSSVAIASDTFLSGIHFAVECNGASCRLVDQKSANGTFLNGARVAEAVVHDGDEITAGKTVFAVHLVGEELKPAPKEAVEKIQAPPPPEKSHAPEPAPIPLPSPPALAIGSWSFCRIPEDWVVDEGYGIHFARAGAFPSEAVVSEGRLGRDVALPTHIESEMVLVREFVSRPQIEIGGPVKIAGADEAMTVLIRYQTDDGRRFWQRQVYARSGELVGVLTLTTLEDELPRTQPLFDAIMSAAAFREPAMQQL
jgi:hypothetical protein